MYQTLEDQIVPLYYDRNAQGVPAAWIRHSKEAIRTLAPAYSTRRMVQDYSRELYVPAMEHGEKLAEDAFALARHLSHWKGMVRLNWHQIHLEASGPREQRLTVGEEVGLEARVRFGGLDPTHFVVEICQGREVDGVVKTFEVMPMKRAARVAEGVYAYEGRLHPHTGGSYSYGVRIRPAHPALMNDNEVGLVRWA
ncbi:hypothetical protein D3C87_1490690 [compost metagenome]